MNAQDDLRPTPEEEAAARATIEAALEAGMRRFYDKVHADALIGPVFARVVHDWDAHIRTMTDFWAQAVLGAKRYAGQPFAPHLPLRIGQAHFDRWLALWKEAAEETMPPPLAAHVVAMAQNMSHCWGRALDAHAAKAG